MLLCDKSFAQDVTVLTAPGPRWNLLASQVMGDFDTVVIPIKRADQLILIEAEIDGVKGDFIFDTGAPGLVLNASYYRQDAVARVRESVGIAGSSALVYETKVKKLQIKEMYFENMLIELTELGHIENKKGIKVLGLLGTALFQSLEWTIDLRAGQIIFCREGKKKIGDKVYDNHKDVNEDKKKIENRENVKIGDSDNAPRKNENQNGIRIPISYTNNAIFFNTKMKGKTLSFCFDTGAEMTVLDNYLPKSIMNEVNINRRINLIGTNGQKLEVFAGTVNQFSLASLKWEDLPVIISGLQGLSEAYNYQLDGIIGYDLLNKAKLKVNLSKREMWLYLYE